MERRKMISKGHPKLSVVRQCKLLNVHRSGLYYKPAVESALNLELMGLMDEQFQNGVRKTQNILFVPIQNRTLSIAKK